MKTQLATYLAVIAMLAMGSVVWAEGLDTTTTDLPPDGVYVNQDDYHTYLAMGIVLDDPSHKPILDPTYHVEKDGADELEFFNSLFEATEIGQNLGLIQLTGPVTVRTSGKGTNDTGTFATEILSMDLSSGPLRVRQDPNRRSLGTTTINPLGGGLYHIDSFFDVFTELSIDGGGSWTRSDTSTRLTLVPEPSSIVLAATAFLCLLGFARRRRRKSG